MKTHLTSFFSFPPLGFQRQCLSQEAKVFCRPGYELQTVSLTSSTVSLEIIAEWTVESSPFLGSDLTETCLPWELESRGWNEVRCKTRLKGRSSPSYSSPGLISLKQQLLDHCGICSSADTQMGSSANEGFLQCGTFGFCGPSPLLWKWVQQRKRVDKAWCTAACARMYWLD